MRLPVIPILAIGLFVMAALGGCALTGMSATGAAYRNEPHPDHATIRGATADVGKFFSEGQSNIRIIAVDGQRTSGAPEDPQYVAPGVRKITIHTNGKDYRQGAGLLEFEVAGGRKYRLASRLQESAFEVKLIDETGPAPREIRAWQVPIATQEKEFGMPDLAGWFRRAMDQVLKPSAPEPPASER